VIHSERCLGKLGLSDWTVGGWGTTPLLLWCCCRAVGTAGTACSSAALTRPSLQVSRSAQHTTAPLCSHSQSDSSSRLVTVMAMTSSSSSSSSSGTCCQSPPGPGLQQQQQQQ
jgi:hypothetical protein